MNPIAVGLDLLLAALLLAALALGARLNARLKTLRNGQAGFAAAVLELNQAAARAEAGLASLRAASEDTHDALLARIETARALTLRLEQATSQAEKASRLSPQPTPAGPAMSGDQAQAPLPRSSLAELAASLKARLGDAVGGDTVSPGARPMTRPPAKPSPRRLVADDDLFEGGSEPRLSALRPTGQRRSRDETR
jgi:hypothetical protein